MTTRPADDARQTRSTRHLAVVAAAFCFVFAACSDPTTEDGLGGPDVLGGDAEATGDAPAFDAVPPDDGDDGADSDAGDETTPDTRATDSDETSEVDAGDTSTADGADDSADAAVDTAPEVPLTYHAAIRPIIEENCVTCHSDGGIGPFALDDFEAVRSNAALIRLVTGSGYMPPWPPADGCREIQHQRRLSTTEIDRLDAWVEAGMPEGDPDDYTPPEEVAGPDLGEPDLEFSSAVPYTADAERPDDYRCLPLDHEFTADTFIRAIDILPDQREIVHHVLMYLVPPDDVARMNSLDEGEEGPGYTCFGFPRAGNGEIIAGWVPGGKPMVAGDGMAFRIPAGARLVMQVHYNTVNLEEGEAIPPDQTSALFWTLGDDEVPSELITIFPFFYFDIDLPAGEPEIVEESTIALPIEAKLIGIAPHMHLLGSAISVTLEREGEETCLIDVPEWDFNWQGFYLYEEEDVVDLRPTDRIRMRCEYDNSAANQPVINGERLAPRDVGWGDGSLDEMCLTYLVMASPYFPGGSGLCGTVPPCIDHCEEGDATCGLSCIFAAGQECSLCALRSMQPCVEEHCLGPGAAFAICASACSGSDILSCATLECLDELNELYTCMDPHLRAGACDETLSECGVAFAD